MSRLEPVRDITTLRRRLAALRARGIAIATVPTMGALHAGHAELLRVAKTHADFVVATIFVNPLQFDRKDDLDSYPKTLESDLQVCKQQGVDLVFVPTASEIYPAEALTFVECPKLSSNLCGAFRPGHFRGVLTVVMKLLQIIQPDLAFFGEKDAQQLALIQRMVTDLNVPVSIIPVPTVRELDGLALSSRNKHLSPGERRIAPLLYESLRSVSDALQAGERDVVALRRMALEKLGRQSEIRVEYFELVRPDTLEPLETVNARVLVAAAIWLGTTRLIDNVRWP